MQFKGKKKRIKLQKMGKKPNFGPLLAHFRYTSSETLFQVIINDPKLRKWQKKKFGVNFDQFNLNLGLQNFFYRFDLR